MKTSFDHEVLSTLAHFGISTSALLGQGGEAQVFSYGNARVLRICREVVTEKAARKRQQVLSLLGHSGKLSFAIPRIETLVSPFGRHTTVEQHFVGIALQEALRLAPRREREALLVTCLDASLEFASVDFSEEAYCDLFWDPPTKNNSWPAYLEARARRSLQLAGPDFARVDPSLLAVDFPEPQRPGFVHFDLYPNNILIHEQKVSAVLDFGGMCMHGDPRLDPLALAVGLGADDSGAVCPRDLETVREWLSAHALLDWLDPAEHLLAAIWSFAQDDPTVRRWTRRVLL